MFGLHRLRLNRVFLLASIIATFVPVAAAVIPLPNKGSELICSSGDPTDCYPVEFVPSEEWQIIKEGQVIPPGLDVRLDWQTGVKSAKLGDLQNLIEHQAVVLHDIEEKEDKKVVNYQEDEEDIEREDEIQRLKMAVQKAETHLDLEDALYFIKGGLFTDIKQLVESLDALTEHSHDLNDGIAISEPPVMNQLFNLALSPKSSTEVKELSLRVIAQSLRHNPEALQNVDLQQVLPTLLQELLLEKDSVLQKRILGVISTLIQTESNSRQFISLGGRSALLNSFVNLKSDSQLRCLEILDDLNMHVLKRDEDDEFNTQLFDAIQASLSSGHSEDFHSTEAIFDRLVELKKSNKSLRTGPEFMKWLSEEVETRKLNKRDEDGEALHKKLLEARHMVFGNPKAMRKALADEL